jgi:hypothetical protein
VIGGVTRGSEGSAALQFFPFFRLVPRLLAGQRTHQQVGACGDLQEGEQVVDLVAEPAQALAVQQVDLDMIPAGEGLTVNREGVTFVRVSEQGARWGKLHRLRLCGPGCLRG